MIHRLRSKLTFANVASSLALFIALGGTGYAAIKLPRNSVGSAQIRARAVGSSELRSGAVTSRAIRRGTIATSDLSTKARASLRGLQGPMGPAGPAGATFRAAVPSGGTVAAGNALRATHQGGTNVYTVDFSRDLAGCIPTATLAAVPSGAGVEHPSAGRITVQVSGSSVVVNTFAADGSQAEQPFDVIVAC
jgi:hypothetical protein